MMKKIKGPISVVLLLLLGLILGGYYYYNFVRAPLPSQVMERARAREEKEVLVIGRVPAENVLRLLKRSQPLVRYLEKELGMRVRFQFARDYAAMIEGMEQKVYHLVHLGPKSYIEGHERAGYYAILKPIRHGSATYRSMIIVRKDSGINTLNDLKGKSFCFTDRESASGYLYPKVLFLKKGINPDKDFKKVFFTGTHDGVVLNVYHKNFAAGACFDDARKSTFPKEPEKIEELRVLTRTPPISNEPFAVKPDLDKKLVERIAKAFLKLGKSEEGRKILEALYPGTGLQGYTEAKDSDYDSVREMERLLKE
ncbi:phosphate/phosphite/phosphonate ABC transporter substrate-binding protein [bacterium]|nr:phosphate/phosphite/phosphonate ABC transporter substrate-binding protein [bacterium]